MTLQDFYKAIAHHLETGENPHGFVHDRGLCTNLLLFVDTQGRGLYQELREQMQEQFVIAGASPGLPFNRSLLEYYRESLALAVFQNPARLAWIKEHAK